MNADSRSDTRKVQWIETRYGPIVIQRHSVMFENALVVVVSAGVPVYKGVSVGVGATEDIAIAALYGDLTGETRKRMEQASVL